MLKDAGQTWQDFLAGFGVPAYDENTVPDDATISIHVLNITNVSDSSRTNISTKVWSSNAESKAFAKSVMDEIVAGKLVVLRVKSDTTAAVTSDAIYEDLFLVKTMHDGPELNVPPDQAIFQSTQYDYSGTSLIVRTIELNTGGYQYYSRYSV